MSERHHAVAGARGLWRGQRGAATRVVLLPSASQTGSELRMAGSIEDVHLQAGDIAGDGRGARLLRSRIGRRLVHIVAPPAPALRPAARLLGARLPARKKPFRRTFVEQLTGSGKSLAHYPSRAEHAEPLEDKQKRSRFRRLCDNAARTRSLHAARRPLLPHGRRPAAASSVRAVGHVPQRLHPRAAVPLWRHGLQAHGHPKCCVNSRIHVAVAVAPGQAHAAHISRNSCQLAA